MNYPYCLLERSVDIFPVCGDALSGLPLYFDFSSNNSTLTELDVSNQELFQSYLEEELHRACSRWGLSGYLENRSTLLRHAKNIIEDGRYYHLGLDIIAPRGTMLYAPLAGEVLETGYEEEVGSYGGYLILKHGIDGCSFYSLYGHLAPESMASRGTILEAGQSLGVMGGIDQNGCWFFHTHLQVITAQGRQAGYFSKGYCSAERLTEIETLCPSPMFLFRY